MKDEEKIIEKIDRYLKGKLDEEEKIAFEEELESDEALRNHLQFVVDVSRGVQLSTANQWKRMLERNESNEKPSQYNRYITYLSGIAASILVIITLVYLFAPFDKPDEELFAAHFTPYPNIESPVKRSPDTTESAWSLYEQGKYKEAAEYFKKEIPDYPENPAYPFYTGISLLASDQTEEAIPYLKEVEKKEKSKYEVQAQWYLGLAYLKAGKRNKARNTFQELASSDNEYSNRSEQILEEI